MTKKTTFEGALAELDKIVDLIERGDLGLEDSIAKFEEGVNLAGKCAELLKTAETRVQKLVKRAEGAFDLVALEGTEEDATGEQDA